MSENVPVPVKKKLTTKQVLTTFGVVVGSCVAIAAIREIAQLRTDVNILNDTVNQTLETLQLVGIIENLRFIE